MIEIFFVRACVEIHMEISELCSEAKIKLISFWFYVLSYNEWEVLPEVLQCLFKSWF